MTTPDKTLLIAGIIMFAVLLIAFVILVVQKKKFGALFPFFILPIAMIGFSEIKTLKGPWGEIDTKSVGDFASNPNNPQTIASFNHTMDLIEKTQAEHPQSPVPPLLHSNLVSTVKSLVGRQNLTAESRLVLSRAQLFLGDTTGATTNAQAAVTADTNLIHRLDPRVRVLVNPALLHHQ